MTSTTLGEGRGPRGGSGFGARGGGSQGLVAATVSVTGLTEQDVRTALQSGQTLTQIAEANGKTAEAVIAAARTALQAQLSAGRHRREADPGRGRCAAGGLRCHGVRR